MSDLVLELLCPCRTCGLPAPALSVIWHFGSTPQMLGAESRYIKTSHDVRDSRICQNLSDTIILQRQMWALCNRRVLQDVTDFISIFSNLYATLYSKCAETPRGDMKQDWSSGKILYFVQLIDNYEKNSEGMILLWL